AIRARWIGPGSPVNENPTSAAAIAPAFNWPSAPMLNRPARNPRATASPAKISGVAATTVSESGFSERATWWRSPLLIALKISVGLPRAPVNSASYESRTASPETLSVCSGTPKKPAQAEREVGSVNMMSRAPSASAVTIASTGTDSARIHEGTPGPSSSSAARVLPGRPPSAPEARDSSSSAGGRPSFISATQGLLGTDLVGTHAGHEQAELLARGGAGGEDRDDPTPVHHGDPVGEGEDLVELR